MIRLCVKSLLPSLLTFSAACVGMGPDPAPAPEEEARIITADETVGLDPDHRLALDVRTASYTIDPSAGPVDLRFVDVITPIGDRISLESEVARMIESSALTREDFNSFSISGQGDEVEYQGFASSVLRVPKCYVCVCDEGECVCERIPCPPPDPGPV